jgi:hypothetical protein
MRRLIFIRTIAILLSGFAITAFMSPLTQVYQFPEGTKEYPVQKFTKLSVSIKAKIYIEQGENRSVDIQAEDKVLEKITVENKGDELQIKCEHPGKIDSPVVIKITTPELNGISLAGSSELFIEKTFKTDYMNLDLAGSGTMKINDLQAGKVTGSIAGSGDIYLAGGGEGSSEDFSIAGSGKVDALGFNASKVSIEIAGSGDCHVMAKQNLVVSIAGSGNVYYKGTPVLKSEVAGSGKVKPVDEE